MFGQTELAAFVHDFETALRGRSARRSPAPGSSPCRCAPTTIRGPLGGAAPGGEAILADLSALPRRRPAARRPGWLAPPLRLPDDTLALGGRPELVLDELRGLARTRVRARLGRPPRPRSWGRRSIGGLGGGVLHCAAARGGPRGVPVPRRRRPPPLTAPTPPAPRAPHRPPPPRRRRASRAPPR
jgi:hypothetical protein